MLRQRLSLCLLALGFGAMMACSKKADVTPDNNGGTPPETENPVSGVGTGSSTCSVYNYNTRESWDGTVQYTITKTGGPGDWLEYTYTGTVTKWNTTTTAPISGSFRRRIPRLE